MTILWLIVTFVAGILLILAEFLLPGGILGIIGVLVLIGSAAIAVTGFPDYALFIVIGQAVIAIVTIIGGVVLLARSNLGRGLVLADTLNSSEGTKSSVNEDPGLIGKTGRVTKPLRPAGICEIDGEPIDAVSDGSWVETGTIVRVLEVHGSRIVVEPVEANEETHSAAAE